MLLLVQLFPFSREERITRKKNIRETQEIMDRQSNRSNERMELFF
jgi:hypothetical protein